MGVIFTTNPYNNVFENGSPGSEQSSQNRWKNPQTDKLVKLWKENIVLIESSRSHETSALDSPKSLDRHGSADLTGQRPAKFCQPSDFFRSANAFLRGLRGRLCYF